jgi:hypothetical protein
LLLLLLLPLFVPFRPKCFHQAANLLPQTRHRHRQAPHPHRIAAAAAPALFSHLSPGLGAFTSLQSLSLKPGTGTGKLLFELAPALQPLTTLKRLHLDFKSALQLEHVQAVADACRGSLKHLSLNMRASSIGSKALESIAQLQQLTSLQLLGTTLATLAGPPAWQALQSMQVRLSRAV